jgi:hypothetical protein
MFSVSDHLTDLEKQIKKDDDRQGPGICQVDLPTTFDLGDVDEEVSERFFFLHLPPPIALKPERDSLVSGLIPGRSSVAIEGVGAYRPSRTSYCLG